MVQNTHVSSSVYPFLTNKVYMGSKIIVKRATLCLNLLITISPELSTVHLWAFNKYLMNKLVNKL